MNQRPLFVALLALAPLAAPAQDSLADKRLAITKGTTPGKVLLEQSAIGAAASAPVGAAAPGSGAASAPARSGLFSRLPPPSGRPLNAARRLDAPDQGIVIKAAPAASAVR